MNQSQYPNATRGNGGQNPWAANNMPQSQVPYNAYGAPLPQPQQNMYSYGYGTPVPASYAAPAYQPGSASGSATVARRPYVLALLAFPFLCLKMYLIPAPGTFAREKDRVGWLAVFTLLVPLALLIGLLLFAWGRVPHLTQAVQALSLGHVTARPLSLALCEGLALGSLPIFLLLIAAMHLFAKKAGGRGRYGVQVYTSLLITLPLLAFIALAGLALTYVPALSGSLRLVFEVIVLAFLLYSILLHIFAVRAVQGLGFGKATLVVLGTVVVLLVIIAIVALLIMSLGDNNSSSSSNSSGKGSGSSSRHGTAQQQESKSESEHGHDDFDFDFESESHKGHHAASGMVMAYCPQCGLRAPLPAWQAQMGASCPRCGMPMVMA